MMDIIGNIILTIGVFCFITTVVVLLVMMKKVKDMANERVEELEIFIRKPLNICIVLMVVGIIFFIVGRMFTI